MGCNVLQNQTFPVHTEVGNIQDLILSLSQRLLTDPLTDARKEEVRSIRNKIQFLHTFAETDSQIRVAMFKHATSLWGVTKPNPNACNKVRQQNAALLAAVEKSIKESNTTIGQKALAEMS